MSLERRARSPPDFGRALGAGFFSEAGGSMGLAATGAASSHLQRAVRAARDYVAAPQSRRAGSFFVIGLVEGLLQASASWSSAWISPFGPQGPSVVRSVVRPLLRDRAPLRSTIRAHRVGVARRVTRGQLGTRKGAWRRNLQHDPRGGRRGRLARGLRARRASPRPSSGLPIHALEAHTGPVRTS